MYNRQAAIEYSFKWAFKRNPDFASFDEMGGDCTNFVSQCLFAGGVEFTYENYGWFYHSLESRAPAWTGVDELWSFASSNYSLEGPKFKLIEIGQIEPGDVVQLNVNEVWTHTLLVTKIKLPLSLENVLVTAHDDDSLNRPLNSYYFSKIRFCKVLD